MVTITYIEFDGTEHVVDVPAGMSVMEGAVNNDIPGIEAECGGMCSCATCHVYVDPVWAEATGSPGDIEQGMLDSALDLQDTSRLACQIAISDELDGLIIRMPELQI
ncbi:MAG: 2Fe-2S iron-sulfur cluster-binding protein [Gammaproteobacteria bacterium]|nr:2Fe-2S iron-sulfur cluster-binding protein [Gammaproteobacteria bacterium]MDH3429488.1 2Fe-2S iron-sulfur cluster-binding protein [Gammaproteobacteria bacterium]MDH3432819.1 2Fe-2S iron-sulfur cluster-binding protein [Gammaproteobacteria bacterium]